MSAESQAALPAEQVVLPTPHLEYLFGFMFAESPDPFGVIPEPESPHLFSIRKATVSRYSGSLRVILEGPMLKKDGGRAAHSRCCAVDLSVSQPDWIERLIADAERRLLPEQADPA